MDIEGLKCDIAHVLQNDGHAILQKWILSCREFRSRVNSKTKEVLAYKKECTEKTSVDVGKISVLQEEIDTVKENIDAATLQRKIIEKKIANVIKSQANLKKELDETRTRGDELSLEMVDLQLGIETKRQKKISQWDAIKRACNIYKVNLDVHIDLEEEKDSEYVKISFFTHNETTKNQYFVQLACSNDSNWCVEQVEPKLKKEHLNELNILTDLSGHPKISNISLFLCQVRNIFLRYYMKTRKKS